MLSRECCSNFKTFTHCCPLLTFIYIDIPPPPINRLKMEHAVVVQRCLHCCRSLLGSTGSWINQPALHTWDRSAHLLNLNKLLCKPDRQASWLVNPTSTIITFKIQQTNNHTSISKRHVRLFQPIAIHSTLLCPQRHLDLVPALTGSHRSMLLIWHASHSKGTRQRVPQTHQHIKKQATLSCVEYLASCMLFWMSTASSFSAGRQCPGISQWQCTSW